MVGALLLLLLFWVIAPELVILAFMTLVYMPLGLLYVAVTETWKSLERKLK